MRFLKQHVVLLEPLLWLAGIGMMILMDPVGAHLFSFCPFNWLSLKFCPGCGLGHAIAFLARGELAASWNAHPLGIPAIIILTRRSFNLLHWHFTNNLNLKSLKNG
jgi:hypothetical protein